MSTQGIQNITNKYNLCLIVSRHQLLKTQKEDIENICSQYYIIPDLPTNPEQLKQMIKPYDAVVGVIPLPMQIQIIQNRKALITFVMESLGTTDNKQEAEQKASQYEGRSVILPPSKEGEKYRVTVYEGLKIVREIKIVDEWIVQHQS